MADPSLLSPREVLEQSGDPRFAPGSGAPTPSASPEFLKLLWQHLPPEARKAYASFFPGMTQSLQAAYSIPGKVSDYLSTPPEPRAGYNEQTAPPELRANYAQYKADPNLNYGRTLPVARHKETGEIQLALPDFLRQKALGALDLQASPITGELTPRAVDTLTSASTLAGGLLAQPGALGAGGAPRRSIVRNTPPENLPPTTRPDLQVAPPSIGHNNPPFSVETAKPIFDETGRAIKSAAYSKASQEALRKVKEAGKGAGPLDLSGNQRIPGILQENIPRYDVNAPRRHGVSERMQAALANQEVIDSVLAGIDRGVGMGADKWYHNKALHDAFVNELGPEEGFKQFQKYMDYQAAASPRSDVPTNIRNASYYYVTGNRHPEDFKDRPKNEYPYGHLAANNHRRNADVVRADQGDWGGFDVMQNPKPPSYGTNLGGNLNAVAADTHAFRAIAMASKDPRFLAAGIDELSKVNPWATGPRDLSKLTDEERDLLSKAKRYGELVRNDDGTPMIKDGAYKIRFKPRQLHADGKLTMDDALKQPTFWDSDPNNNEYKAVEDFYTAMGVRRGLKPAEAQSAGWSGSGELTGLQTAATKTFGEMHNERVLYTAYMRGETPEETMRKLIRREAPLLSLPAGGAPTGLLTRPEQVQPMTGYEAANKRSLLDSMKEY